MSAETIPAVEVKTEFHIDNDVAANWLLSKLANLDAEIVRVQAQAALIVRQLEGDKDSLLHLYQDELAAYVAKKIEAHGGQRKSIHFLQGSAGFRRVPAHVSVTDTSAALLHAKEAGLVDAIKTVERLDADAYRTLAENR